MSSKAPPAKGAADPGGTWADGRLRYIAWLNPGRDVLAPNLDAASFRRQVGEVMPKSVAQVSAAGSGG